MKIKESKRNKLNKKTFLNRIKTINRRKGIYILQIVT